MRATCFWIAAALAILLNPLGAAAETGFLDRSVTLRGNTYAYQVYVPADYLPTRPWPVIVYLHGNDHQGEDGMRQTNAAMAESLREHRSWFPAIIVFPQARPGARWMFPEMEELVMAELDRTIVEFHGDASRIYLTGFSMGGTGTYRLAYQHKRFAALLVVAGRVEPGPRYTAEEVQTDRKTNAFVAKPDPFASLAESLKGTPIWIFHGNADRVVDVEQSRKLVTALKSQRANVKYIEYPGVDHVEAAAKAYSDQSVFEWLLQQRLQPAR